ncbi:hypothetical protein ACNKW1_02320 [Thauera sp. WH-2]|uniref:hypothetical protein n=1 Tax=Thauera sp. WH-2 TaxID=3401574 RepID=UPI003AAD2F62
MNVSPILDRLEKVRQTKPDSYRACCPAHDDRTPSLDITDAGDRVLLICRAGCTFDEIRAALGMQAHEFFADGKAPKSAAPGVSQRALNAALVRELVICWVIAADRAQGKPISPADIERERIARQRITTAWGVAQ